MSLYFQDDRATLHVGDCRTMLAEISADAARACVTSPPYWGLRDYGVDGQLGAEATPEEYVSNLVAVFREVRRVLADDGTLWLNLGDSYARQGGVGAPGTTAQVGNTRSGQQRRNTEPPPGLKHKDLVGIPWMVAFALRADGWWLRADVVWHKPNPMPESVTDRPTKAHEYVFLLTKSERYFYDAEAAKERAIHAGRVVKASSMDAKNASGSGAVNDRRTAAGFTNHDTTVGDTRNARSVWSIATTPFDGAHFATMPPELARRCILAGSAPGDVVLDPFNGAGTTGMVAMQHRRRYLGMELNPEYAALTVDRWRRKNAQELLPLGA